MLSAAIVAVFTLLTITGSLWQICPQDPVDLIGDVAKMGIYKPEAFKMADVVNAADLRKTLLLKMAGKGNPKREKLVFRTMPPGGGNR